MKKEQLTAVEWLINEIDMQYPDINVKNKEWMIDKAVEMEKEQKGYSEEDVIKLLTQRSKHFGTNVKPFQELLLKQDLEWFEQFKQQEQ
jgi:hypothetical protein